MFSKESVPRSAEWARINALPWRTWDPEDRTLADQMTELLRTPQGTMRLKPIQAQALYELGEYGGISAPIPVGGGKTLISLLMPHIVQAIRPVLLVPSALKQKTEDEWRVLSNHWQIPANLRIMPYEFLSQEKNREELEKYGPDFIVADEAHKVKSKKAAVTRRVMRYMREHPETRFAAMSGTLVSKSILECAHILKWTHKQYAPLPSGDELIVWANALDEKVNPLQRVRPGPITEWYQGPPTTALIAGRRGFARRLTSTPGIIATSTETVASSLRIEPLYYRIPATTDAYFKDLRADWRTPDGWTHGEASVIWQRARELAAGFHGIWSPRPPDEWMTARSQWAGFVRNFLSTSRSLDTELQVRKGVLAGEIDDDGLYAAWARIAPSFTIQPKDVWHDDTALTICQQWAAKPAGIVWVSHVFFGQELARRTGMPYFRTDAADDNGRPLNKMADVYRESGKPPPTIICSTDSCVAGQNLQPWNRNLITTPASGNLEWEQLLGRTHRFGQLADEVTCEVMFGCYEHFDSWMKALAAAHALGDTMNQPQKIATADVIIPSILAPNNRMGHAWERTQAKEKGDD